MKPLIFLFLPLALILLKKEGVIKWGLIIATLCSVLLFLHMNIISSADGGAQSFNTPDNINPVAQIENLTSNPKRGLRVLWSSYMTPYGDEEARGLIGIFGSADTPLPLWISFLYIMLVGSVVFIGFGDKRVALPKSWIILGLSLCVLYFIAVNLALYMSFTPVNFDIVYGVQGRYFLPIVLVLVFMTICFGVKTPTQSSHNIKKTVSTGVVIVVFLALFTVLQRYFLFTP